MFAILLEIIVTSLFEAAFEFVFRGYFRRASTNEIGRWKLAAWCWLGLSVVAFCAVPWLAVPFAAGLAIGTGLYAAFASIVCSSSASILHRRWTEQSSLPSLRSSAP